jgi:hypothetical protein
LQDPPKFAQIGIFDLKTNHLATLFKSSFIAKQNKQGLLKPPIHQSWTFCCSPSFALAKERNFKGWLSRDAAGATG